jgi:DNA modification methylase
MIYNSIVGQSPKGTIVNPSVSCWHYLTLLCGAGLHSQRLKNYTGGTGLKIKNDNMKDESFYQFLYDSFVTMFAVTKKGGAIYVCHADSEGLNFRKALIDSGWLFKQCIIWIKNAIAFKYSRQSTVLKWVR